MNTTTLRTSDHNVFSSHNTPRDRQESIRRSWTPSEKNRRRELAAIQQLRLLELLQVQAQRTAC